MCRTAIPRASSASAMSWRWQRHGTASAHMTTTGCAPASAINRARACSNAGVSDRKSTRLNSSHSQISYAVFCLKKKKNETIHQLNHILELGLLEDRRLSRDPDDH